MTTTDHPYPKPEGSDVEMFIQWKGTVVCLDLHCTCGAHGHVDAGFAYAVRCPICGAVFELGTQVIAKRHDDYGGSTVEMEVAP